MVRATVSQPPDMVRFTIETWPCRVAAMASSRWACTGIAPECREAMARVHEQVLAVCPDSARPYRPISGFLTPRSCVFHAMLAFVGLFDSHGSWSSLTARVAAA